jgi:hypothetical protein
MSASEWPNKICDWLFGSLLYASAKHITIVSYLTLIGLALLTAILRQGKSFLWIADQKLTPHTPCATIGWTQS